MYRTLVVPVGDDAALDVACRLASDRGARLVLVAAVVVPAYLPLDAHMREEEALAHETLSRAHAVADGYGVAAVERVIRARDAAEPVLDAARREDADAIVVTHGRWIEPILRHAPCRTLVLAAPAAVRVPSPQRWDGVSASQRSPAAHSSS